MKTPTFFLSVTSLFLGILITPSLFSTHSGTVPVHPILMYQQDYVEIDTDQIIASVTKAVETVYPEAGIAEAFIDKLGNYKLVLAMDKEIITVYLDQKGNWNDLIKQS